MKRPLSRAEWLLVTSPVIGLGLYAGLNARLKEVASSASPVPLTMMLPVADGQSIIAVGREDDASGEPGTTTPLHILAWDTKASHFTSRFTEKRPVSNWAVSSDGKQIAFLDQGHYNTKKAQYTPGTINLCRVTGEEIESFQLLTAPAYLKSAPDWGYLSFSPHSREIIRWNDRLERYDLKTGAMLGSIAASRVFSGTSRFKRASFSPDGRLLALIEDYSPRAKSVSTNAAFSAIQVEGGRAVVVTYPALQIVQRLPGDLYMDCSWDSSSHLRGIATFRTGNTVRKLVRVRIDVASHQMHREVMELPTDIDDWNPESLSINGTTGQVLFAASSCFVVWGHHGKVKKICRFSSPTVEDLRRYRPIPTFSTDGRVVFRINGNAIERYDLRN